jgi:sporulation protein YlmC with PRC-barrel domain
MADRTNRGMRDEAGVGPNPNDAGRLIRLKDLRHFKIADGEPDIRGWAVYTATGRELGEIDDLLVDTEIEQVVMVDVDLKRDDRHTLAPIKAAWIDREHHRVVLNTSMFDVDGSMVARDRARVVPDEYDATALQPERRRDVRYAPTHAPVEDIEIERRVVDSADLSPSETERLRQQSGDITHDARDTLVNPPPTDERR